MKYDEFFESLDTNHPLKSITFDDDNKVRVAFHRENQEAFFQLSRDEINKDWFREKIGSMRSDTTKENVSSILGEFRAYSLLKKSYFGNNLICKRGEGSDFASKTLQGNKEILIEVNTPLGRSDERRTTLIHKESSTDNGTSSMKEFAPFGMPERKKDNFQCEAISKISTIKKDETQFNENSINILFIDFVNPFLIDYLDVLDDQQKPYIIFQDRITWGAFWHSFYSKKDDKIFDRLNNSYNRDYYSMEYNGRFHNPTKINFVFINQISCLSIYQGFNTITEANIYPMLLSLNKLSFENLWINWPIENLKNKIEETRTFGELLYKQYYI
jgi:hypothetical protein